MKIIALKLLILLEMTSSLPVFAKDPPKAEEKGKSTETNGKEEASSGASSQLKSLPGGYVHKWTKIPALKGYDLSGGTVLLEPVPGKLTVIMFMASWCVPCQDMIPELRELDKKYAPYGVNFYYAFSHDMPTDVRGFVRERKISPDRTSLITDESLKDFRDPLLPTLYLADRKGWIIDRFAFEKNSRPDLSKFKEKLKSILLF
jgi:thiol-disulfide isomerase/thioredoxin